MTATGNRSARSVPQSDVRSIAIRRLASGRRLQADATSDARNVDIELRPFDPKTPHRCRRIKRWWEMRRIGAETESVVPYIARGPGEHYEDPWRDYLVTPLVQTGAMDGHGVQRPVGA